MVSTLQLASLYDAPKKLPPAFWAFWSLLCDGPSWSTSRLALPSQKVSLKSRDLKPTNRLAMRKWMLKHSLMEDSCKEKVEMLETIIKTGMEILLPVKTKTILLNEPPWMNNQLTTLIQDRQKALSCGDVTLFHQLRNRACQPVT